MRGQTTPHVLKRSHGESWRTVRYVNPSNGGGELCCMAVTTDGASMINHLAKALLVSEPSNMIKNTYKRRGFFMQGFKLSSSVILIGAAYTLAVTSAHASGYHFGSQSVSAQGTAHASGAEADDASTIFYNPAGMSRLDGTHFSMGLTAVIPDSKYTDTGSVRFSGQPTGGDNGGNFAPSVVVAPSLYITHKVNDKVNIGLGMFVPYGAQLSYDSSWAGRYGLQSLDLMTININPSISYKFNDHHSIGLGVSAQYIDASLRQGADATTGAAQALARAAGLNPMNPVVLNSPAIQRTLQGLGISGDGYADVTGDDWGFGWNVGYMYQLDEKTRFGLAYRSQVRHTLNGSIDWNFNQLNGSLPGIGPASAYFSTAKHPDTSATVNLVTPESASANFFHQINDKFAVMGDVTWTRHSRLNEIRIKQGQKNGISQGDIVINQDWKDTFKFSLGGNYRLNEDWLLRAGIAYDQSPVRSDELRHPALPDSDRIWLSLGGNYRINKNSSIDFAYSYVDFKDADAHYSDSCSPAGVSPTTGGSCTGNGGTVNGSYKTYLQFVGVQYNYAF